MSALSSVSMAEQPYANAIVEMGCSAYGGLATAEQIGLERQILDILRMPEVMRDIEQVKQLYRNDPLSRRPSGSSTIDHAASSISAAMAGWGAIFGTREPRWAWVATAGHSWFGLTFPNSGFGIENPDNVYRHAAIDGQGYYIIRGRISETRPLQQSFILYRELPGTAAMSKEGADIIAILDRVEADEKGNFEITVSPEAAGGQPNHMKSVPGRLILIARDSLADWSREIPISLSIERIDDYTRKPYDRMAALQLTRDLLNSVPAYWAAYDNEYIFSRPANTAAVPRIRGSGWGMSTSGHFDLADDQALVVTLDEAGAKYVGFQLADVWGVATDYVRRTGSLNNAQIRKNGDGTVTYVIAVRDPGVYNWLDTHGLGQGIFAIRWQKFAEVPKSGDKAIVSIDRIELAKLDSVILDPALRVSGQGRAEQLEQRMIDYKKRVGCF